jgi:hypothetical protein
MYSTNAFFFFFFLLHVLFYFVLAYSDTASAAISTAFIPHSIILNSVFHACKNVFRFLFCFSRHYSAQVLCVGDSGKLEDRILAIIVNTQAGVEESWYYIAS